MGSRSKQPPKPETVVSDEDQFAENLVALRNAHKIAKEGWKTEKPDFEQVLGVLESLEDGALDENMIAPLFLSAREQAAKIGLSETEDILTVLEVILEDEKHEEHFDSAAKEAKELFGPECSGDTILGVYYLVFGAEAGEEE
jgi:hypothetical protein